MNKPIYEPTPDELEREKQAIREENQRAFDDQWERRTNKKTRKAKKKFKKSKGKS